MYNIRKSFKSLKVFYLFIFLNKNLCQHCPLNVQMFLYRFVAIYIHL